MGSPVFIYFFSPDLAAFVAFPDEGTAHMSQVLSAPYCKNETDFYCEYNFYRLAGVDPSKTSQ